MASMPTPPVVASVTIEGASNNSTVLVLRHVAGDPIRTAFSPSGSGTISANDWADMEVRVNGAKVATTGDKPNDSPVSSGTAYDFIAGDTLELRLVTPAALQPSDVITIIYKPANEVITTTTVPQF